MGFTVGTKIKELGRLHGFLGFTLSRRCVACPAFRTRNLYGPKTNTIAPGSTFSGLIDI